MTIELVVGKKYQTLEGKVFTVISNDGGDILPFSCSDKIWRDKDGTAFEEDASSVLKRFNTAKEIV